MEKFKNITLHNGDCMDILYTLPDKAFDLAIVDPPYGLDFGNYKRGKLDNRYHSTDWDKNTPPPEYFEQLMRISKNQIIWGGNYFDLPPTQCFVFWYKRQPVPNYSAGELAIDFEKMHPCKYFRAFEKFTFTENAFALCKGLTKEQIGIPKRLQFALQYVQDWTKVLDINLDWFIEKKNLYNETRPEKHGKKY